MADILSTYNQNKRAASGIKHEVFKDSGEIYGFTLFESLAEFTDFVNKQGDVMLEHNKRISKDNVDGSKRRLRDKDWFGDKGFSSMEGLKAHNQFQYPELIPKTKSGIEGSLAKFLELADVQRQEEKKLKFNDRGLGVFVFDRAAMGLYKRFYSQNRQEIVPTRDVIEVPAGSEQFYDRHDPERELLDRQYKTNTRDVYAYFPSRKSAKPGIKLYVPAGGHWKITGPEMLHTGMAACVGSEYLEAEGLGVEINLIVGTATHDMTLFSIVKIKRFTDYLDKNLLALLSSDPANFRYYGFESIVANYDFFGQNCPSSLGRMISTEQARTVAQAIEDKAKTQDTVIPIVIPSAYSMPAAKAAVQQAIDDYKAARAGIDKRIAGQE